MERYSVLLWVCSFDCIFHIVANVYSFHFFFVSDVDFFIVFVWTVCCTNGIIHKNKWFMQLYPVALVRAIVVDVSSCTPPILNNNPLNLIEWIGIWKVLLYASHSVFHSLASLRFTNWTFAQLRNCCAQKKWRNIDLPFHELFYVKLNCKCKCLLWFLLSYAQRTSVTGMASLKLPSEIIGHMPW